MSRNLRRLQNIDRHWPSYIIINQTHSSCPLHELLFLSIEHFNICHSKFDSILFLVYFIHLFILSIVSKSNWTRFMIYKLSSYTLKLTLWNHGCFLEVILIQLIKNSRVLSLSFWWHAPGIQIWKWKRQSQINNIL